MGVLRTGTGLLCCLIVLAIPVLYLVPRYDFIAGQFKYHVDAGRLDVGVDDATPVLA